MDVVYFNVAHFLECHVGLSDNLAVAVFLCNFVDSLDIFFLCLIGVALFILYIFYFAYFFSGERSFPHEIQVLKVGMVQQGRANRGLELLFSLYFFVH